MLLLVGIFQILMYSCLESALLRKIVFLKILVIEMLGIGKKKNKTAKRWRSRAMLIDPKKTRITIIDQETQEDHESQHASSLISASRIEGVESSEQDVLVENKAIMSEIFGIDVSFAPVEN
jgi:hypothetical protein